MKSNLGRLAILLIIIAIVGAFFYFDAGQHLNLDTLKEKQADFDRFYQAHPWETLGLFFLIYVATTAVSLPGAAILTLAAGALFDLWVGLLLVSFASTLGASLAFLSSRLFFHQWVQTKFAHRLQGFNEGVRREGGMYLFTLRLVPAIPFFLINLGMGLTPMKLSSFWIWSQIGMLPGTFVYVNAGTQLGDIKSLSDIISFDVLLSFVLLAAFPFLAKFALNFLKAKKVFRPFRRPKTFDYNLVVIGAGAGGLVSSYIAATVKAKVALIEKDKMGGDCLNTGCVPSKALIKAAKVTHQGKTASRYGLQPVEPAFKFSDVMDRVHETIKTIEPHDSVERYTKLGVDCFEGKAKIKTPFEVEVNGQTITTKNIIIATGAKPFVPPLKGLDQIDVLTSENLWQLRELPKKLVVLGGGPIGSELTQAFQRLGSHVTQIERADRIMGKEDPEVSDFVTKRFKSEGIEVLTKHEAKELRTKNDKKYLVCEHQGREVEIEFDAILFALGRAANVSGFGLEELDIELSRQKTIQANDFLQTKYPNIFVVGDAVGPYQFTHIAAHTAWFASVNALFSPFKKFRVDYRVVPWCTYVDPEVARVGLSEDEAKAQGVEYEVTTYGIDDLDRAITENEAHGFVKVLTPKGKDRILGATIVGARAGDIIAEFVLAMKYNIGLNKILGTIHIYPTFAEANKYAAGEWKRAHAPKKALDILQSFHRWRRGG